jgi:hypothetical protein
VLAFHTAGLLDNTPDTLSWLLNCKAPGYLQAANLLWRLLTALILALGGTSLAAPLLPSFCKLFSVSMQYITYFNRTPATVTDEKYVMEVAADRIRGWQIGGFMLLSALDLEELSEPEVAAWKQLLAGSPGLPEAACAQLAAQVQVLYDLKVSSRSRSSSSGGNELGTSYKMKGGEQSEDFATKFAALLLYPDHLLVTSATEVATAAAMLGGGGRR